MPELPDAEAYLHALRPRIQGRTLRRVRRASPFVLRTALPPIGSAEGRDVVELRRLGKRVCIGLDGSLWLVIHLMIAGRLHWRPPEAKLDGRYGLAALDFDDGSLVLSEAGSKKRASLRLVEGEAGLAALDPGGVEPLGCTPEAFATAVRRGNHTLKRALTDPHLLAGIGNAYSDEILHAAKLSPLALTGRLTDAEIGRLHAATQTVLRHWVERLCAEADEAFPEKVTAFRPGMAAHGRYGKPCPDCGTAIQRIRYASNEANYCPRCQTDGRLLADRGLSRLLGKDWPKTIEELEERRP